MQRIGVACHTDISQLIQVQPQVTAIYLQVEVASAYQVAEKLIGAESALDAYRVLAFLKKVEQGREVQRYLAGYIVAAHPIAAAGIPNGEGAVPLRKLQVFLQVLAGAYLRKGGRILHQRHIHVIENREGVDSAQLPAGGGYLARAFKAVQLMVRLAAEQQHQGKGQR